MLYEVAALKDGCLGCSLVPRRPGNRLHVLSRYCCDTTALTHTRTRRLARSGVGRRSGGAPARVGRNAARAAGAARTGDQPVRRLCSLRVAGVAWGWPVQCIWKRDWCGCCVEHWHAVAWQRQHSAH